MANKRKYSTKTYRRQDKQIRRIYEETGGKTTKGKEISYRQFKHRVTARMQSEDLTARQAALKEKNTVSFTTAAERSRYNLTESIKRDFPEAYKEMSDINRGIRNNRGQFTAMHKNLSWNKQFNAYQIGDYIIDVSNSPKGVYITPIDKMRAV